MNVSEKDFERLENKIDILLKNSSLNAKVNIVDEKQVTDNKKSSIEERRKRNRENLEKILFIIPKLEKTIEKKTLTDEELQDLTDVFLEKQIMGIKNKENAEKFDKYKTSLTDIIRIKIFLDNAYEILDNYLNLQYQPIPYYAKRSEWQIQDSLETKKVVLKKFYGYKLQDKNKLCKTNEELAEILGVSPVSAHKNRMALLDDLAPDFFGLDGLYIE